MNRTISRVALALFACTLVPLRAQDQRPVPTTVWAPKPTEPPGYTPPLKPWVKLADLKTKHNGEATWRELLVDDGRLTSEYVAAAPGTKVGRRFHPDTRAWFAVVEGEVRVEIYGPANTWHATRFTGADPACRLLITEYVGKHAAVRTASSAR